MGSVENKNASRETLADAVSYVDDPLTLFVVGVEARKQLDAETFIASLTMLDQVGLSQEDKMGLLLLVLGAVADQWEQTVGVAAERTSFVRMVHGEPGFPPNLTVDDVGNVLAAALDTDFPATAEGDKLLVGGMCVLASLLRANGNNTVETIETILDGFAEET